MKELEGSSHHDSEQDHEGNQGEESTLSSETAPRRRFGVSTGVFQQGDHVIIRRTIYDEHGRVIEHQIQVVGGAEDSEIDDASDHSLS